MATSARFPVKPEIIEWALAQSKGVNYGQLSKAIDKWISGEKVPTVKQIKMFSDKTHIPFGYFFLDTPPEEKVELLEYRTVNSQRLDNPSRNLIDTIYEMENMRGWMSDYRKNNGLGTVSVAGCMNGCSKVADIVNRMRVDLGLLSAEYGKTRNSNEGFAYIRDKLEDCGVIVMINGVVGSNTHRPLDTEEFRAFAMVDEWAPLIFINGTDSDGGRLFSLLHEAAHVWIGVNDLYNESATGQASDKDLEKTCNAVAAELLVPGDVFLEEWEKADERANVKIEKFAKRFKCGQIVIARRALDYKKISRDTYDRIVEDVTERYKIDMEIKKEKNKEKGRGGNYYNTKEHCFDERFLAALFDSVNEGETTYTEACHVINTSLSVLEKLMDRMGV